METDQLYCELFYDLFLVSLAVYYGRVVDWFIYLFIHFYFSCLSCIDICVHGHGHLFLRVDWIVTSLYKSISNSSLNPEQKVGKYL